MATVLFVLSLMVVIGLPLLAVTCMLSCGKCEQRRKAIAATFMQMQVARDLAAMQRKARQLPADLLVFMKLAAKGPQR